MTNKHTTYGLTALVFFCAFSLFFWLQDDPDNNRDWDAKGFNLPDNSDLQTRIDNALVVGDAGGEAIGADISNPIDQQAMIAKLSGLTRNVTTLREPDESELAAFYQANLEQYRNDSLFSFRQLFFSSLNHGGETAAVALQALQKLNSGEPISGDQSPLPPRLINQRSSAIDELFGAGFSEKLLALYADAVSDSPSATTPPEQLPCWTGPVAAASGVYLVCLEAVTRGEILPLEEIRLWVINDWRYAVSARPTPDLNP